MAGLWDETRLRCVIENGEGKAEEEETRYNTCCGGIQKHISRSTLTKTDGKDEEPGNQQTSKPQKEETKQRGRGRDCELVFLFREGEKSLKSYNHVFQLQNMQMDGPMVFNVSNLVHAWWVDNFLHKLKALNIQVGFQMGLSLYVLLNILWASHIWFTITKCYWNMST